MKLTNLTDAIIYVDPNIQEGLEEVVLFPNSVISGDILTATNNILVFRRENHSYTPQILGSRIGRGFIGLIINDVDAKEATDQLCATLKDSGIFSREETAIMFCSSISTVIENRLPTNYKILLINVYAKNTGETVPKDFDEAVDQMKRSSEFRHQLSESICKQLGLSSEALGDWCYNSVEVTDDNIIYRKDVLQVKADCIYPLFSGLNSTIMLYTPDTESQLPPHSSLPYRIGIERDARKIPQEYINELKKIFYVPSLVDETRLKLEIGRYGRYKNGFFGLFDDCILSLGSIKILSYTTGI